MIKPLIFSLALPLVSQAQLQDTGDSEEKAHSPLPALRVLPAGSKLSGVRLPRYNPDYTPSSLLTADKLTIVSKTQILAQGVQIHLFQPDGSIKASTKLKQVDYDQKQGLLKSDETIVFSGPQYAITSQGLILDWDKQRGFFLGKNQTIIYLNKPISMKDQISQSGIPSTSFKAAAAVTAAATLLSTPKILSAEDLAALDKLAQPSTAVFKQAQDQVVAELKDSDKISQKASAAKTQLIQAIGEKNIPNQSKVDPFPEGLKVDPKKDRVSIKSEGDLYFDALKGLMILNDNVTITHPQYTFKCKDEVKITLKENPKVNKLTAEAKAKLKPNERFGGIDKIIATDDVRFQAKDKQGKPMTARAGRLTYDHTTGVIILTGLNSRITTVDKQFLINKKNGYIRIDKNYNVTAKGAQLDFNLEKIK